MRNVSDGISLLQIAEGGMNELTNILIRLRELSVQAASDTISDTERGFSDIEFQSLQEELDRITAVTEFNGRKLLNGTGGVYDLQVGIGNNSFEDRIRFRAGDTDVTTSTLGVGELSVATKENAQEGIENIDEAISKVAGSRAMIGAMHNRLNAAAENLNISIENQSSARSRISDTDYAAEVSNNVRSNILVQSGTSVLSQANVQNQAALKLLG